MESLALGKVRLAVILDFLKELLFHHLAVFHHIGLDLGVLGLFDLDPLDGVVQQISGKRYDVIVGHLKLNPPLAFIPHTSDHHAGEASESHAPGVAGDIGVIFQLQRADTGGQAGEVRGVGLDLPLQCGHSGAQRRNQGLDLCPEACCLEVIKVGPFCHVIGLLYLQILSSSVLEMATRSSASM